MQRSFVETGAASSIVSLIDKGIGLGASEQQELVPLQREIIEHELQRQNEAQQQEMPSPGSGQTRNPRAGGGGNGLGETETVRYVNESEKQRD